MLESDKPLSKLDTARRNAYLFRVPSHSTNGLAAHVVESQTLLLRLDIPHGHETCIATGNQDMCNPLIPVQAFDIICTGRGASQSEGIFDVMKIGDVKLHETMSQMDSNFRTNVYNTSPFAPPVASRLGCLGLN